MTKIPQRPLGRTGFAATVLGIGDLADRAVPLAQCVATLHRAMDHGLNLIDTAPGYEAGYSEQIVGTALKGRRDGMFVIDKLDDLAAPVAPQVDASLRALDIETVDLFAFHAVTKMADWERIATTGMAELARCQAAGKVRFRGLSSHHPDVLRAALASGLCDVVMFPIGPFVDRRYRDEILPLARAKGEGTVCFKTFGAGKLLGDTTGFKPCTPAGVVELLVRSGVNTAGAEVVILGRGNIVGKPMAAMLCQKGKGANSTVTICHSATRDIKAHCLRADIIIAAMGVPEFLKADMVKPGVVGMDVGVNRVPDATAKSGTKLVGDVAFAEVQPIAGRITPNPGGVGPMTIAMLMANTVTACERLTA